MSWDAWECGRLRKVSNLILSQIGLIFICDLEISKIARWEKERPLPPLLISRQAAAKTAVIFPALVVLLLERPETR